MTVKAVVFDMDGVIFDSERLCLVCWTEIAEKYGISDIEAACRECLGVNDKKTEETMLARYGADFPYEAYRKEASALFHSKADGGRLPRKPGVKELLTYLKENGVKLAVASSTRYAVVKQELGDGGLLAFFDAVIGGDMVKAGKPAPDIFLRACRELGAVPEETYVIEDSYNGIRAAHAAGMIPVMVPDLAEPTEEMKRLARVILPSLCEVKEYFCRAGEET